MSKYKEMGLSESYPYELTMVLTARKWPAQAQARKKKSSMERGGRQEAPFVVDEIMANDCLHKRNSQSSLRVLYMAGRPCFRGRPQIQVYTGSTD